MNKINWKEVKHRDEAWSHVSVSLDGEEDVCTCTVCKTQYELPQHARVSVLLFVGRTHYYKHRRWEAIPEVAPAEASEVPLFI